MNDADKKAVEAAKNRNGQQQTQVPKNAQPVDDFFNSAEMVSPQAAAILAANKDQLSFNSFYISQLMGNCNVALVEAASKIQEQQEFEIRVKQEAKKLAASDSTSIEERVRKAAQNLLKERDAQIESLVERETQKAIGTNMQEVNVLPLLGGGAVAVLNGSR